MDANGLVKISQVDVQNVLVQFSKTMFSRDSLNMQIQTEIIDFRFLHYERKLCEGLFTKDKLFAAVFGPAKRLDLMAFQLNVMFPFEMILPTRST